MDKSKFKVGDLVLYKGGLFRVEAVWSAYNLGKDWYVQVGEEVVPIECVSKADWRDVTRITKGGTQ